ncbi:SDR family oxidoreductase, partial [Micrococcus sp. SIMBA_131]
MTKLSGKVAIVTGAASGFGAGIASRFVREGANVVLADINVEGAKLLAEKLGPKSLAIRCDVTNRHDIERVVTECVSNFGVPNVVVNNAGTTHKNQPLMNVEEGIFDKIYAVNVKSI